MSGANLRGADLSRANLSRANLSRAGGIHVDALPDLDKQILNQIKNEGCKLNMESWHTCKTTHCRAGWAVTIHPAGKTLESIFGTNAAGALIYSAAYPSMRVPNFFATNEETMADMEKRAASTK